MSASWSQQVVSRLTGVRRRIFLLAGVILAGVLVHLTLFHLASVPMGPGPARAESQPWIGWEGEAVPQGGPILREQALLLDAEPLFVPTVWNTASSLGDIASLRDEAELFIPFPVRLGSASAIWRPRPVIASGLLMDRRLETPDATPFRLIGRAAAAAEVASTVRLPRVEILRLSSGEPAAPTGLLQTAGGRIPDGIWSPLEFLIVVDPTGSSGRPLRLNSSGFPDWDAAVAGALSRHPQLAVLPNGYFRVTVGP